jgi:F-type H+-transporting ATPase subunit gamma
MPGIKELKTRIKSIGGTRKVTRAMQMVSAAKMRKSQDATLRSRNYSTLAWELVLNLSSSEQIAAGLLKTYPKAEKAAVLVLSTNRGMVGSLNSNLLNLVQKTIETEVRGLPSGTEGNPRLETDFITYGRKGRDVMVKSHKEVLADFVKYDRVITTADILPIAQFISTLYSSGKYQKVLIFYNHFVSTLAQKPTVKQLLPFIQASAGESPRVTLGPGNFQDRGLPSAQTTEYLFEPNSKEVLEHLLPRIIESQIYQTILESEASEQSARMVMMKNATEAAGDLITDLTLTFNKLRQNKITTELAEITAGKIALE